MRKRAFLVNCQQNSHKSEIFALGVRPNCALGTGQMSMTN